MAGGPAEPGWGASPDDGFRAIGSETPAAPDDRPHLPAGDPGHREPGAALGDGTRSRFPVANGLARHGFAGRGFGARGFGGRGFAGRGLGRRGSGERGVGWRESGWNGFGKAGHVRGSWSGLGEHRLVGGIFSRFGREGFGRRPNGGRLVRRGFGPQEPGCGGLGRRNSCPPGFGRIDLGCAGSSGLRERDSACCSRFGKRGLGAGTGGRRSGERNPGRRGSGWNDLGCAGPGSRGCEWDLARRSPRFGKCGPGAEAGRCRFGERNPGRRGVGRNGLGGTGSGSRSLRAEDLARRSRFGKRGLGNRR